MNKVKKPSKIYEIDKLDKEILTILIKDARVPFTDIAKRLNVSGGTIHFRIKKLEEVGVISGSNLNIDPSKIGYDVVAFAGLNLKNSNLDKEVFEKLTSIPEIVELHITTGDYTMFAKIICKDTKNLYNVLSEKINAIQEIEKTETLISLQEVIKRPVGISLN